MVEEEHTVMPVAPSVPEEQDNQESTIIVTKEVNTVPPTAPKNNNTLIIILVCAIVAILGIFAALYFATDIFKSDDKHEDEDEMEMLDDDEWSEEDEEEEVVIASSEEEEEDYDFDEYEYEDTEAEDYEGYLPPEAYFTFTGNVGSFGRYQLNVMGDEGVISPNDPDKHGYLSNIYYDSETGYLSMDASNTSGVNVGTYEGTVMHEDDHYVYEGNFTNTSGRSTSFRMIGN